MAATITLFLAAWWVLVLVARPLDVLRGAIVVAMAVGFALVLLIPPVSRFLALNLGPDRDGIVAVGVGVAAMMLISAVSSIIRSGRVRTLVSSG